MKLESESFMKLYDLVMMDMKLYVFNCSVPSDIELVTMNHLRSVSELMKDLVDLKDIQYA